MDNKATTKRMIGAVVLVLVAALLLAWLLKGKNRDGQQDLAMNQSAETKPILGFPGVGGDEQKPTIVGDDPNAAAQQQGAGIDVTQQQGTGTAQQAGGTTLIPGVDVKLPETAPNTTGFEVRPGTGGEVRDVVDTDGKVKDGTGSMGTGDAKAATTQAPAAPAQQAATTPAPATETKASSATASASQKDKPAASAAAPEVKKPTSNVVLVNEKPVPRATSEASAAAKKAAEEKAAAIKKAAEEKAAAIKKAAEEKAAADKSLALANAGAATTAGSGAFSIQVLASSDKAKADATASPLKADGYKVSVSTANVGGKAIYRVNVTGFADRAAAEAAQAKMKSRYKQNSAIQGSFVTSSK
ncbi:Cell division protein DedD (protein involved in septation) [Thiothrix caldifontis]|uniref:Cell division protein DedD (Protein involved in septation) n=1 Tax=Thiothrix caldifontis TaxID=525918 RepID=A0A1H4D0S2_9GAMM|nr:SPOR domain-containing protein [Thiothrix caldifontis]SEA65932.1 Cell division protein DedD (protein involved in septation) [Thiothrix caldifontis]